MEVLKMKEYKKLTLEDIEKVMKESGIKQTEHVGGGLYRMEAGGHVLYGDEKAMNDIDMEILKQIKKLK